MQRLETPLPVKSLEGAIEQMHLDPGGTLVPITGGKPLLNTHEPQFDQRIKSVEVLLQYPRTVSPGQEGRVAFNRRDHVEHVLGRIRHQRAPVNA